MVVGGIDSRVGGPLDGPILGGIDGGATAADNIGRAVGPLSGSTLGDIDGAMVRETIGRAVEILNGSIGASDGSKLGAAVVIEISVGISVGFFEGKLVELMPMNRYVYDRKSCRI